MDWYYVDSGGRVGPVNEAELDRLVREGSITGATLVWHAGMSDWQPYEKAKAAAAAPASPASGAGEAICCECGRTFSQDDMIRYGDSWVCGDCKPIFFQKLKEGAALPGAMVYGGFWIRAGAKIIDGIIVGVTNQLLLAVLSRLIATPPENPFAFGVQWLLSMVLPAAYTTFFLGKYGATVGKMACGLKVVTADGGKVSYLRGFGRHFAEFLSSIILCIGYIMAAFDEQKRTLHDHICNTRVIKIRR